MLQALARKRWHLGCRLSRVLDICGGGTIRWRLCCRCGVGRRWLGCAASRGSEEPALIPCCCLGLAKVIALLVASITCYMGHWKSPRRGIYKGIHIWYRIVVYALHCLTPVWPTCHRFISFTNLDANVWIQILRPHFLWLPHFYG
jgi:hypothetical protein